MARDGALVTTWRWPRQGREAKSLEVFMEFLGFWSKRAAEGKCSEPETFFMADGSGGMGIVKGRTDVLTEIWMSEEHEQLIDKGQWTVEGLQVHLYVGGTDQEITRLTSVFAQNGQELGYM